LLHKSPTFVLLIKGSLAIEKKLPVLFKIYK
jgi:hypothetical protein